jgi:hypothetical protein
MLRDKANPHHGSSFESFLEEAGILDNVMQYAKASVRAWQKSHKRGLSPKTLDRPVKPGDDSGG